MSRRGLGRLHAARRDLRGGAVVEFALIAPILSAVLIGIAQYGGMIMAYDQMHDGVASGALYLMRGGSDPVAAHDLALGAWANKPADATVTVAQSCTCAGASSGCGSVCADGGYPHAYWTVTAAGTYAGLVGSQSMSAAQVVRTQ